MLERDICCRSSHLYFSMISSNRGLACPHPNFQPLRTKILAAALRGLGTELSGFEEESRPVSSRRAAGVSVQLLQPPPLRRPPAAPPASRKVYLAIRSRHAFRPGSASRHLSSNLIRSRGIVTIWSIPLLYGLLRYGPK